MVADPGQLLLHARDGTPGAMERLCDQWLPVVLGWTTRLGGPRIDPEDAAHDVFLVVFRRLGDVKSPERFPAWLFGVTRRVVAAHRRRAWIRRWLPGLVPDTPSPAPDPERCAEQAGTAERVWDALESLPAHQREVLVLCDLEERADAEVAQMLSIPKPTVKSRLRRARIALRARLAEVIDPELPDGGILGGGAQ